MEKKNDSYFLSPKTWGTYIYGIFDNREIVNNFLKESGQKTVSQIDFHQFKKEQQDKRVALIRENVDIEKIYNSMELQN